MQGGGAGNGDGTGSDGGEDNIDFSTLPVSSSVIIKNRDAPFNNITAYFSIEVNGVMYNADKSQDLFNYDDPSLTELLAFWMSSEGYFTIGAIKPNINIDIKLSPSAEQKAFSSEYVHNPDTPPDGIITTDGTFAFRLYNTLAE